MREALKLALEALEWCHGGEPCGTAEAITAIKEALAQPDYRAVKTYHEGKPVYVSQPEQEPDMLTIAYMSGLYEGRKLEREACAVLAEKTICDTHIPTGINIYGTRAAKAIRARGNT